MTAELEGLARAYRRAQKAADEKRDTLHDAILKAVGDGVRQVDIVTATGYTRERIRQLVDKARRERPAGEDEVE